MAKEREKFRVFVNSDLKFFVLWKNGTYQHSKYNCLTMTSNLDDINGKCVSWCESGTQNPFARSPWRINFLRWNLTFLYLYYAYCCISPFGAYNFEVSLGFWKNCTPLF